MKPALLAVLALALAAPGSRAQTITQEPCPVQNADGTWVSGTCKRYHPAYELAPARVGVKLIDDRTGEHVRLNLPVPKRTADKTFWATVITDQTLLVGDNELSQHYIHSGAYESNWLFGKNPSRLKMYGITEAVFVPIQYIDWRAKRERDAAVAFGAKPGWTHRHWYMGALSNGTWHSVGILVTLIRTKR